MSALCTPIRQLTSPSELKQLRGLWLERTRDALGSSRRPRARGWHPVTVTQTCTRRDVPFDCLSDPGRALEHTAQIARFKPTTYAAFAPTKLVTALRAGARPAVPSDILKGRVTYVVNTLGLVTYSHVSQNAADIPPIDDLLDAVRAAASGQGRAATAADEM